MAEKSNSGTLGSINISPNAIAMVAGIAALQCFGVVGMASRTIQDGISELLTGKDNLSKGIEVDIDGERVTVDLYIIVEYGVRIKEVAYNVIENVKYAIENQLGLKILKVNVIVQGVRIDKNKS
ncbi:MAG TPA: Asp23/Gls24 family envelope stress response protein [Bacillota bacterium]|mgnify:FL=1|nr:Asp23/Gls24 family envelope stress response protein [Bacillota bacterium]HPT87618.1 Asp23/Gls24 family envelope stress response protein [Bacillota bacterium]